jgi:hypothetical protein
MSYTNTQNVDMGLVLPLMEQIAIGSSAESSRCQGLHSRICSCPTGGGDIDSSTLILRTLPSLISERCFHRRLMAIVP